MAVVAVPIVCTLKGREKPELWEQSKQASAHNNTGTRGNGAPRSSPMLPDGVRPRPPMRPAHRSEMMSPYRLGMTSTSNCAGFFTSCMHALSTISSSYSMSGCFSCTCAKRTSNIGAPFYPKAFSIKAISRQRACCGLHCHARKCRVHTVRADELFHSH